MGERTDPVAMVTGASGGIGRHVACGLLEAGYQVVLVGRRQNELRKTAERAGDQSARAWICPVDVGDAAAVTRLFSETRERFGRLDLLFNNAGISLPATPIEDMAVEDWQRVVDTNLTGVFLCTQAAVRIMKTQDPIGGRIINNGSVSAHSPRPDSIAYTATKHAVTGLTKSTSLDGRRYNIACGQIDIGNAATDMVTQISKGVPQADGRIAAEPTMDPHQVTRAVLYMASLPLDANVQFMTVMATQMPFVGRG